MMTGTALIAEPDPEFARRMAGIAEECGLQADVVRSGDAAATKLVNRHYDVLITELSLPGIDGFALIQALRARYSRDQTRVVVVSGFVEQRTLASQLKDGLGIEAVIARNGPVDGALRTLRRSLAPLRATATVPSEATQPMPSLPSLGDRELDLDIDDGSSEELAPIETHEARDARERVRLVAVQEAGGEDPGPPDPELQRLIADIAREFGVDSALISFMFADKQWFKAYSGIDGQLLEQRSVARDLTFCKQIIDADVPKMMVVPDAAMHPAFMKNPAVVGGALRSYVGAPLITATGQVLGTLCLFDKRPSRVTAQDMDRLTLAARHIAGLIEMRTAEKKSQRLEAELALVVQDGQRIASRWIAVLDHLDVGIVLMNASDGVIVYANEAVAAVFGLKTEDLRGLTREQFVNGASKLARNEADFRHALAAPAKGPYSANAVVELALPRRLLLRWSSKPMQIDSGLFQMATFTDVTAEVDLARTREREARIDPLTGLANRRGFAAETAREIARSRRSKSTLWVAMLDLDHFKRVNDVYGHPVGDTVLVAVANAIRKSLRTIDVISRRGGEEFVALLGDVDDTTASIAAERVRSAIANLRLPSGPLTISIGIAPVEAFDVEAAIAVADGRLYEAKRAGRNRVVGPATTSVQT